MGEERWLVFTNFALLTTPQRQPDDLDIVCIGPRGVILQEVKHWDGEAFAGSTERAEAEVKKLKSKAERLGGLIRKSVRGVSVEVKQWFVLTREGAGTMKPPTDFGGAKVFALNGLKKGLAEFQGGRLSPSEVDAIRHALEPRSRIQTDGKIRRLADFENLELDSPAEQRFHRTYRGVHRRTREKVIVHLYDLSASEEKDPRRIAEREFRVLQVLQKSHFVPRFRDSLQELPDYPGEIWFFTVFDPDAPTIEKRASDQTWSFEQRLEFARQTLRALKDIHGLTDEQQVAIVHRNLSPNALLVGGRNRPVITNFALARLPLTETIAQTGVACLAGGWVAPEVRQGGLVAATAMSDVFSVCMLLRDVFADCHAPEVERIRETLADGSCDSPADRATLDSLLTALEAPAASDAKPLAGNLSLPTMEEALASELWCSGTEIKMSGRTLRVLSRLGSGGIGTAFKVEEFDPETEEPYGTFVAKVIRTAETGDHARRAYLRVRPHAKHAGLASVYEVAEKWQANRVVSLLQWLEGESLHGIAGCAGLAVEECEEASLESLINRWIREACEALAALHTNGLAHGDVSPKNLIYHRSGLRLTDFDLVTRSGEKCWGCGAKGYSSPESDSGEPLSPADDIFALAASLFETVFDRSPFLQTDGAVNKQRGLNWPAGADRAELGGLATFFEKATASRPQDRFRDASDVLAWLRTMDGSNDTPAENELIEPETPLPVSSAKTEQKVSWLDSLLTVYPGSPHGNVETRGLDSEFAVATYVPTRLETELVEEIRSRKTSLVVLCGNAGDGKTALLQRIAAGFGADVHHSAQRIWERQTSDGLMLKANLDGSAAWQGRSADELLDDLLLPFLDGPPTSDRVHLLAVNDGQLLKWVDKKHAAGVVGPLVQALTAFLDHDGDGSIPPYFRFISLNHRSLAGGQEGAQQDISATFLNDLIEALLGGKNAAATWAPCMSCTAWDRCVAGPTAQRLLAAKEAKEGKRGTQLRLRIAEAMQAVHQRGNVHVTARELRGTLSYILFGIRSCQELHENPNLDANDPKDRHRIGDLAFDPASPCRQGDLLLELSRLDPALEAHPHLDRWLIGGSARDVNGAGQPYPGLSLPSARRRAYFEWLPDEIAAVAAVENALGLASGLNLGVFRAASLRSCVQNAELCEKLCRGMSQLEDLPAVANQRKGKVPLRVPPRTPTESKFWTEQPLNSFRLEPELPLIRDPALTVLPRRLKLIYQRGDGLTEVLPMGYELFHILLRLAEGEQLSEQRSDDLFANLQIFTQRIAQEESRSLLAWSPKEDATVFQLALHLREGHQVLALEPVTDITT